MNKNHLWLNLFFVFLFLFCSVVSASPALNSKTKKDVRKIIKAFTSESARKKYREQLSHEDEGGLFFASELEEVVKCGRPAVPYLIELRNDDGYVMRMVVSYALKRITSKEFCVYERPMEYEKESLADRKKCVAEWKGWWIKAHGKTGTAKVGNGK